MFPLTVGGYNMRKLIVSILAFVALGLGTAQAQDAFGSTVDLSPDYYAGVSAGLSGGGAAFFLHFGISDLITEGIGTRFSLGYGGSIALGADVIANLPVNTGNAPLGIYAGAGLGLGFHRAGTNVSLGLLVGAEYRFPNFTEGGLFLEFGPAFSLSGAGTAFNLKGGFNYHF